MKESIDIGKQRFENLLSDPTLFKKVALIFLLFIMAMTLFGIIVGSLLTVKIFPNANL
jgi:hypothetical protein